MKIQKQYKTCKEYEQACRASLETTVQSAVEAIAFLAKARHELGPDRFELPPFPFATPKFIVEMMDLMDLGNTQDVVDRVHDKVLSRTLEHVNQGDN